MHFDLSNEAKSYKTSANAIKAIDAILAGNDYVARNLVVYIIAGREDGRFQPVVFLRGEASQLAAPLAYNGFQVVA